MGDSNNKASSDEKLSIEEETEYRGYTIRCEDEDEFCFKICADTLEAAKEVIDTMIEKNCIEDGEEFKFNPE